MLCAFHKEKSGDKRVRYVDGYRPKKICMECVKDDILKQGVSEREYQVELTSMWHRNRKMMVIYYGFFH